jgi:hypothetical protein
MKCSNSCELKQDEVSVPRRVLSSGMLSAFVVSATLLLMPASGWAGVPRIGVIGDSMSDEYPVLEHGGPPNFDRSWVEILQTLRSGQVTFNNQAIDGAKTYTAISRGQHTQIRNAVAAGQLDVVVVALGVNNIAFGSLLDLLTFAATPESVADRIERDLITILNTVESGGDVPIVLANLPDFTLTPFARNSFTEIENAIAGGPASPFYSLLLALAPDDFIALIQSGLGADAIAAGYENVQAAVRAANERILSLATERGYVHGDLYKFFNEFSSEDLTIAGSIIPRELLYSEYDQFHPSSILGGLAGNVAMAAVAEFGFDTESLVLSDQEILNFWNGRAATTFSISGSETYLVDPSQFLTAPVPEASSFFMLLVASAFLVPVRWLLRVAPVSNRASLQADRI